MILINYGIDHGAFGYGHAGTAIVKPNDTLKDLRQFTLPNTFTDVKWIDNKTAIALYDITPDLRSGSISKISDKEINGIKIVVKANDYISDNFKRKIEHSELSPDGKNVLVAFRYTDGTTFSPIQISIISKGDSLGKYGNFYIGTPQSDYVLNATWNNSNQLIFYTNQFDSYMIQYYLVDARPAIPYSIVIDDKKYGGKYLWTE